LAFLSNYPKAKIAGAWLNEEYMRHFIVKMSKNFFEIVRVSDNCKERAEVIHYKKFHHDAAIHYKPLVRVASERYSPVVPPPPLVIKTTRRP
jgi:hypothetical protein